VLAVFIATLAALIPITNPIGAVAAFAGLSAEMSPRRIRAQAIRTAVYVAGILVVFAAIGTPLLAALGITIPALQIAGGLVVMHSGFGMLIATPASTTHKPPTRDAAAGRPSGTSRDDDGERDADSVDISFSPMALPLIAGPGAIGVVIGLTAKHTGVENLVAIVAACLVIAAIIAAILRFGTPLIDRIGSTGVAALTRIMGFLIMAIGVQLALAGILAAFPVASS
jgi:multiple antibiotic resistance protein